MNPRLTFMLDIIKKIGDFQRKHFRTEIEYETKSGTLDIVSFVDKKCEKIFQEALKENFPEDAIMGEESFDSGIDYRKYNKLWIIDPLDGTLMFKRGIPTYGPMMAYVENGNVECSAIFFPEMNELYHADKNEAYCNNKKISVSEISDLKKSILNISFANITKYHSQKIEQLSKTGRIIDTVPTADKLCMCAQGLCDGGIKHCYGVWDTVPGGFLVQQAGGKVTNFGSDTWDIFNPNVIFSNGLIHAELQKLLES